MSAMVLMTEDQALDAALAVARGHYQRDLVLGAQRLSGADLKGKASRYSSHYASSRRALLARLAEARVPFALVGGTSATGPRRFVFGQVSWIHCCAPDHPDCLACPEIAFDCARRQRLVERRG